MKLNLERFSTAGAFLAAVVCPICFPKLALIGAALGLGTLAPHESWFSLAAQAFLVLATVGHVLAYRRHHNVALPALSAAGTALVVGTLWFYYVEALVYVGLAAVAGATVWSIFALRKCNTCAAAPPSHREA